MIDSSGRPHPDPLPTREREKSGRLAENILYFARALRAAGIPVGPGAVLDALEAVSVARVGARDDFYWTLHAVFVKRHEHSILFDQAFRIFFRKRGYIEKLIASMLPETMPNAAKPPPPGAQRVQEALFSGLNEREHKSEVEIDARLTVSDREILQKKDFAQMTAAEIAAAKEAIARLALPLDQVRTRRLAPSRHGHIIDIRRTLRASMKAGGAVIDLKYLGPRVKEPPIVALLDISGSMSQYTRLFLHFLHAITNDRDRVHTLVFGTRLTNITRHLRNRDVDIAMNRVASAIQDWAGGTRIGVCLAEFNRKWARRLLGQNAVVLLISDGLDRDVGEGLGAEMERLHKSCRKLVWLNPLLRYEGFQPRPSGVRAMLPHVDAFMPVHNIESLVELARELEHGKWQRHSGRIAA